MAIYRNSSWCLLTLQKLTMVLVLIISHFSFHFKLNTNVPWQHQTHETCVVLSPSFFVLKFVVLDNELGQVIICTGRGSLFAVRRHNETVKILLYLDSLDRAWVISKLLKQRLLLSWQKLVVSVSSSLSSTTRVITQGELTLSRHECVITSRHQSLFDLRQPVDLTRHDSSDRVPDPRQAFSNGQSRQHLHFLLQQSHVMPVGR